MLNKIFALEKSLRSIGAYKEAVELLKIATPLIDAISFEGERKPSIGQSSRQDWFDSIKLLKDNVIVFHFNRGAISREEDKRQLESNLSLLFSGKDNLSYRKLKKDYSALETDSLRPEGNLPSADFDSFKKIFPKAAAEAEKALSENELTKDDAIFFIYNEHQSDKREVKSAPYFAHDLGHLSWDILKTKYPEFMSEKIYDILSLYKKKSSFDLRAPKSFDPNAVELLSSTIYNKHVALGSMVGDQFLRKAISSIFSRDPNNPDAGYDLISLCSKENEKIEITIPDELKNLRDETYTIAPEDKETAKKILEDMLNTLKSYLSQKKNPEEYLEYLSKKNESTSDAGLLPDNMKGKIFLMELF